MAKADKYLLNRIPKSGGRAPFGHDPVDGSVGMQETSVRLGAGRSSQPRRQNAAMSSAGMPLATSRADAAAILGWTEVNFGMTLGNSEQNATPPPPPLC